MQYISESAPARRLSVDVVLDKRGRHVATIRTLYPADGAGRLRAEIQHTRAGLEYSEKAPHCVAMMRKGAHTGEEADRLFRFQRGTAGGYGYDKRTAALSGLIVAGHTLADHCGSVPEAEAKRARLFKAYQRDPAARSPEQWRAAADRIGARWVNWRDGQYTSLHFDSGLRRLERFGFEVVRAL